MRRITLAAILLLAVTVNAYAEGAGMSGSISSSSTTTETTHRWRGFLDREDIGETGLKQLNIAETGKHRAVASLKEAISQQKALGGLKPATANEYFALMGLISSRYFDSLSIHAQTSVFEAWLRSPNKGAISLNTSTGLNKSLTTSSGANAGGSSFSTSNTKGHNQTDQVTTTSCDENLRYLGYNVGCMHGNGTASILGIDWEFKNYLATKAEGVLGETRWTYQAGKLNMVHIAKSVDITFSLNPTGIKVIDAKGLATAKKTIDGMDTLEVDRTYAHVDLMFKNFLLEYYPRLKNWGQREYDIPLQLMSMFVARYATEPAWVAEKLEQFTDRPMAAWEEGFKDMILTR